MSGRTGLPWWRGVGTLWLVPALLAVAVACTSQPTGPGQVESVPVSDSVVNQRLFDCLTQQGFAVTRGPEGEITFVDPADEQSVAYEAAHERCRRQLVADGLLPAIDEEFIRREYRQLATLHDCLAANGFETGTFPSEDTYVERREELTNLFTLNTDQEWDRARQLCPDQMAAFESGPGG